jgi:hypothetical protein
MTLWFVCVLLAAPEDFDPCIGPPVSSYDSEQACIDGERAAFARLNLRDPFASDRPLLRCTPRHMDVS